MVNQLSEGDLRSVEVPGVDRHLTITGLKHDYIPNRIAATGNYYESGVLQTIARLPLRPGLVVDAGANIGNHTLFFAEHLHRQVAAFEPEPTNYELLTRNVTANGLVDRVDMVPKGLWHETATLSVEQKIDDNWGSFAAKADEAGAIEATTLDEYVGLQVRVALIKIDTEGAELSVLRGAAETLNRDSPFIVVEAHTATAYREVCELLTPLGYRPIDVAGVSDNFIFSSERSALDGSTPEHLLALSARVSTRAVHKTLDRRLDAISRHVTAQAESQVAQVSAASEGTATRLSEVEGILANLGARVADDRYRRESQAIEVLRNHRTQRQLEAALAEIRHEAARAGIERDLWKRSYEALANARSTRALDRALGAVGRPRRDVSPDDRARWVEKRLKRALESSRGSFAHEEPVRVPTHADKVRVGIATIPNRAEGLKRVVDALYPQVDEICIYLNGRGSPPEFVRGDARIRVFTGPDLGDRGKFQFLEGFNGYYLTADDDIKYPRFYVEHLLDGVERYERRAAVGWHGSIVKENFADYYTSSSRRVFTFRSNRPHDTPVHILGTGCVAFHTSTIDIGPDDFPKPNMADVYFAAQGQRQRVPFVVLAHGANLATPIEMDGDVSISGSSMARSGSKRFDVREETNRVVRDLHPWSLAKPSTTGAVREQLHVAIVGRTDEGRWKKGGILKSTHLTADMLRTFGVSVDLIDIETSPAESVETTAATVAIVYPGGPDRPDFANCMHYVESLLARGIPTLVNLSLNGEEGRSRAAVAEIQRLRATFGPIVYLMSFADEVREDPVLAECREAVVAIPKSIERPGSATASFVGSSGVFLGDIGKLLDPEIVGDPPVEEWLTAIRRALPEAPLLAVAQYRPRVARDLGVEVLPYLKSDMAARLSQMRVMVNLTLNVTFDMLPIEVASLGVPVVHRPLAHSLSSYFGMSAIEVTSPTELAAVLPDLYRDPAVWRSLSRAGAARAVSVDYTSMAGQLYLRLRAIARDGQS